MVEIVFRNPFYLWSLVVVPVIIVAHFLSLRYSKNRAIKFANFIALARVSEKVRMSSNFTVLFLRVVVFVAIVFAIAGTTLFYSGEKVDADYVIAIDSSASMLAEDFFPTRFEAAKESALSFVNDLPVYASVGVIGFSGTSYIYQPLSIDKELVRYSIDNIGILTSGGTSIGDAVVTGTNLLINSGKPKVIVVLTDGRSNLGVGVGTAMNYANANNIIVYTIGVGTEEGYFLDVSESVGPLGVDVAELERLASFTGGEFYHPQNADELMNVYDQIAKSKKTKVSLDLTFFLLIFILLTLVVEWVLINTRYRIIP